jgi:hypothetical protein
MWLPAHPYSSLGTAYARHVVTVTGRAALATYRCTCRGPTGALHVPWAPRCGPKVWGSSENWQWMLPSILRPTGIQPLYAACLSVLLLEQQPLSVAAKAVIAVTGTVAVTCLLVDCMGDCHVPLILVLGILGLGIFQNWQWGGAHTCAACLTNGRPMWPLQRLSHVH